MSKTVLEQVLSSEVTKTALELAAKAREHPIGTALGTLGLLSAHALYKSFKSARAFSHIDGPESPSFMWGHASQVFDPANGAEVQEGFLKNYGSLCRLKGIVGEDQIWTADPRAMHEILVKECDSFRESENLLSWIKVVTGESIITVHGHRHKLQRKLLNPVFTPKHMRDLVPTFGTIANIAKDIVMNKIQEAGGASATIDIYKWVNYASLEMIGQAGMGHSFGAMEDKESDYLKAAGHFFPTMFQLWYIRPFLPQLMKIGPRSFRRFVVNHTPLRAVQEMKEISHVMEDTAVGIYNRKKEAAASGTLHAQVAAGKDIMTLLLQQNELMPPDQQMTEEELIAQVNGFVFAGSDTTSSALARTLHLLALHPDIQTTLRAEVSEAFKPSRWLEELPLAVREAKTPGVYSSMMTFSGGPRACIGFKFSQVEMKIVLTKLINAFKFELGDHQISWGTDGIIKPHAHHADGTRSPSHTMPMKVSVV
ncbi:hypothetical protein RSAG8_06772, partial [Rhizoctonia solani AG-8 WAC10335]